MFPYFYIGPLANLPRDTYEVLLNSKSVVHSRNVTWARLPPSVPVSAENVRPVSVSRRSTGVRSRVTARLVAPTPAAVPCGRAAPVGGRGTAAATSLRGATMREIPGIPVHSSADTPGGLLCLRPLQHRPG